MARAKPKTPTLTDFSQLGCRGLKTFETPDGGGFNYRLTVDSTTVGEVHQGGFGGPVELRLHPLHSGLSEPLDAVALARKPEGVEGLSGPFLKMACLESLLGRLVDDTENRRRFKRMCRTKTLFQAPGDDKDTYRTIAAPFSDKVKAYVLKTHPGATFYNETL